MAANGYRTGYEDNGVINGKGRQPESGSERDGHDTERGQSRAIGYKGKDEPFGDETNSEVKYRTMAWWYEPLNTWSDRHSNEVSQASRNDHDC